MSKILFIGTYLSGSVGSKGVCETVAERLRDKGVDVKLASHYQNKIVRLLDIIFSILLYKGKIVHIDVFSGQAFIIAEIASFLAVLRNKRVIMSLRGGNLPDFTEKRKRRVLKTLNRADRIQTPSLFLRSYFSDLGFQIHYLPNGVSFAHFPYKRTNVIPFSILWVRAFNSIYNPDLAVKIVNELKSTFPDIQLTMIGPDNGLLKSTQSLISDLNLCNL